MLDRASSAGDFWSTFPRSGQLISFNKRYTIYDDAEVNLRWDWNSLLTGVRPPRLGAVCVLEIADPTAADAGDILTEYLQTQTSV